MLTKKFGIEVELTGITRAKAAEVLAQTLQGIVTARGETYVIAGTDGRIWKVCYDGSIQCQKGEIVLQNSRESHIYSVEVVSPILYYEQDIGILQTILRALKQAGGKTNSSCGIHIHLDGTEHTTRSIRNFVNLVASRNDLFYKALQINPNRQNYCKKMDSYLVSRMNEVKPNSLEEIEQIWYAGYSSSIYDHYHPSRYHFLNLHSFFHGHHTVELRGFNSTLHAGKVRAYIVFALAMNGQALSQKSAHYRKVQAENEKFAMRVYLNRIGLIGDEFKNCRKHLCQHLDGNAAWRYGSQENCRNHRERMCDL